MALYGEKKCEELVGKLTAAAKEALAEQFADTAFLDALADSLAVRKS